MGNKMEINFVEVNMAVISPGYTRINLFFPNSGLRSGKFELYQVELLAG
jgi:hypothetical protein